jgi:hypothetical protein
MAPEAASGIVLFYAAASGARDGAYRDPTAPVEGREALVAHIGGFHGRPQRIVGFFGPFPHG